MQTNWTKVSLLLFPLAGVLWSAPLVSAYDDNPRYEREERRPAAARMSERDLSSFEDYLNAHDETAQLLYQDPDLIKDRRFVRNHEALHDWLENHPDGAAAIQADPQQFLWRERSRSPQD